MKCTFAICQLSYDTVPDALDKYLQIGGKTSRDSLKVFCKAIIDLYRDEFLRRPTYTDVEKLYAFHQEQHGFSVMLGSIDCTGRPWANCPNAYRAQYDRGEQRRQRYTSIAYFNDLEDGKQQNFHLWLMT
ncbi:probably inactive leucine-rich repeat receptor-like protein kinase [Tanacetum coccineum]